MDSNKCFTEHITIWFVRNFFDCKIQCLLLLTVIIMGIHYQPIDSGQTDQNLLQVLPTVNKHL